MKIVVEFGGPLRSRVPGTTDGLLSVELPDGATVATLIDAIVGRGVRGGEGADSTGEVTDTHSDGLATLLRSRSMMISVDDRHVTRPEQLALVDGAQVLFLSPISGG